MTKKFNVAVVGATGIVGETLLELLHERKFPVAQIHALASSRSAGKTVRFGERELIVGELDSFDFSGVDFALFSAGGSISAEHGPRAAAAGCVVIDNTSHFRMDPGVPLIVPEVNAGALERRGEGNIIANPNCSTIQMVLALAPIHRAVGVERVNVATYQSVSGAGRGAMEELGRQAADRFNFRDPEPKIFGQPIAFNVIPQIDVMQDNGYTREEMKMHFETRKMLEDEHIQVNATAVRVPVFFGHAEAVHLETREPIEVADAAELLANAPGVTFVNATSDFPTPLTHASGKDPVFVSRLRKDFTHPRGLSMWVVSDNVRKGAALNAVQIAELLTR